MDPELAEKIRRRNLQANKWKNQHKNDPQSPKSKGRSKRSLFTPRHRVQRPIANRKNGHSQHKAHSSAHTTSSRRMFAPVRRRSSEDLIRMTYAPTRPSKTPSSPDSLEEFKPGKSKITSKVVYDESSIYDEYIGYDLYLQEMNIDNYNKKQVVCSFHMDFIPDMEDLQRYVCEYGNIKFIQYENYTYDGGPEKGVPLAVIMFIEIPSDEIFVNEGRHEMENELCFRVYKSMNDFERVRYARQQRRRERQRTKKRAKRKKKRGVF